ncbi:MAG: hypothetical protein L6Q81_07315 [Bacteroidia bacterium]|nr:hypothetical protein [Bacteroidia bacterium]
MRSYSLFFALVGIFSLSFESDTVQRYSASTGQESEKVISFLCNNADSLGIYLLQNAQVGDSIYVNYFDRISDDELRPKIVTNYLNNTFYKKMMRDSISCDGKGQKHNYDTSVVNKLQSKVTSVNGYATFLKTSKSKDIYLVQCRPLVIGDQFYYLVSLESNGTSYLERVWVEVSKSGCITEVGSEFGIK